MSCSGDAPSADPTFHTAPNQSVTAVSTSMRRQPARTIDNGVSRAVRADAIIPLPSLSVARRRPVKGPDSDSGLK
jgi:hypothetical protein